MGRVQATEDGETQSDDRPVGSAPPVVEVEENPAIGKPWSTGLFDCHENQTNAQTEQMARPAAIATITQNIEHAGISDSIPQHNSTDGVVNNLVIGRPWSTGLFDCHEHQTNAVMTAFLPCVTFGQIAEVLDGGELTCPLGSFIYLLMMPALCSQWIMGSKYRTKLRKNYDLVEAPYEDKISHIFCPCCSLCQEFRELKNRGLDPALGWNGILAQQQGRQYQDQQVKVPPQNQAMHK